MRGNDVMGWSGIPLAPLRKRRGISHYAGSSVGQGFQFSAANSERYLMS